MGETIHIQNAQPHIAVLDKDQAHIIPLSLLRDVIAERKPLTVLGSDVIRLMLADYLELIE